MNLSLSHFAPFQERGFSSVNLSSCNQLEEIRFFAGMFPLEDMPLEKIYTALHSITSRKVGTVVLDLNMSDIFQPIDRRVIDGLEGLDEQLCRIASQSFGHFSRGLTVKLSAFDPCSLGKRFRRFRRLGRLIVGTRYASDSVCICGELRWIGYY